MPEDKQEQKPNNVISMQDFRDKQETERRNEAAEEVYAEGKKILRSWGWTPSGDEGTQHGDE